MVLLDNQDSSPKSVLDDKAFQDSSSDSDFDVDLYLNDEEENGDNVVVPKTPSEEVRTEIYNIRIPPSLIRGIGEDKIWDKIRNPLTRYSQEHLEGDALDPWIPALKEEGATI
ncbi:hypothetical protein Tco_0386589 [Tanacetum coccineum]